MTNNFVTATRQHRILQRVPAEFATQCPVHDQRKKHPKITISVYAACKLNGYDDHEMKLLTMLGLYVQV